MSLERFRQAQASKWAGYATALAEMQAGRKSSHWIWYIFPQIDGLGRSSTAREYALRDLNEACDYLRDPVLRSHYEEITNAVAEHIGRGAPIEDLMGSSIDASKLASSLTLFRAAALWLVESKEDEDLKNLAQACDTILERTATQGYPPCEFTLERIAE